MTETLDKSIHIPEDVVFRELQGEAVILNLESSTYFRPGSDRNANLAPVRDPSLAARRVGSDAGRI